MQLRDTDGVELFHGVEYRKQNMVEIQVPALERSGSYIVQVFNGKEEVSEAVIKAEDDDTQFYLKALENCLLALGHKSIHHTLTSSADFALRLGSGTEV